LGGEGQTGDWWWFCRGFNSNREEEEGRGMVSVSAVAKKGDRRGSEKKDGDCLVVVVVTG